MAINRKKIIDEVYDGTRVAATGWVSPGVYGYKPNGCGPACTYDPAEARRLYKAAGGHSGPITISSNADSSHKAWVSAVCESIRSALGATCRPKAVPTFAGFRSKITNGTMTGLFRSGWQLDYPSVENFLGPLYGTNGYSNDGAYSNAKFDALRAAAAKVDPAAANTLYQEAERTLRSKMPAIPLWHIKEISGYSTRITGVRLSIYGTYDLTAIRLR